MENVGLYFHACFRQFQHRCLGFLNLHELHRAIARLDFHLAFGQRFFADADADGKTDQLRILELHAGALITVVQNNVNAFGRQFGLNLFRELHRLAFRRDSQRRDANLIWRDAQRPDDSVLVIPLLDDCLQGARDTDAVIAHYRRLARAVHVEKSRVQLLAVFRPELEDVADFNRTADFQRLATLHAWLASGDGA